MEGKPGQVDPWSTGSLPELFAERKSGEPELTDRPLWDLARASPLQCGGAEAWRQGAPPTSTWSKCVDVCHRLSLFVS